MQFLTEIARSPGDCSERFRRLLRFSYICLLFLLPLSSFAQAHLLKLRPFRATDTRQSGDDHTCDLRRDCDADGRPDRLGDYVEVSGTVIAEPSTFDTDGWLFWIRDGDCGILVYGEQETLAVGDSVAVYGCLRVTNGSYFFPETGLATLGDVAIENMGVSVTGRSDNFQPVAVSPAIFSRAPEAYGGNLVTVHDLYVISWARDVQGNLFMGMTDGYITPVIYIDIDTHCSINPSLAACYTVTGIVVNMRTPPCLSRDPTWCIAPRSEDDITTRNCFSQFSAVSWGMLKSAFRGHE